MLHHKHDLPRRFFKQCNFAFLNFQIRRGTPRSLFQKYGAFFCILYLCALNRNCGKISLPYFVTVKGCGLQGDIVYFSHKPVKFYKTEVTNAKGSTCRKTRIRTSFAARKPTVKTKRSPFAFSHGH